MDGSEIAAIASAIAAIASGIAAWFGPSWTAKHADAIRKAEARDALRRQILMILLRHRASFASDEGVSAINLIDFAFPDDTAVREAKKSFMDHVGLTTDQGYSDGTARTKLLYLIREIVSALGMSKSLTIQDIETFYFPRSLLQANAVEAKRIDDLFRSAFPDPAAAEAAQRGPIPKRRREPSEKD